MSRQGYPSRQLGDNGPEVSAIGFGTMAIGAFYGETDKDEAFRALTRAADMGQTFWDCADIYGSAEATLAKWFGETGRRSQIFLATKFGARKVSPQGIPDLSPTSAACSDPAYIPLALQNSLDRLQTNYIDLYYQHRVDPNVPIEIVLETLRPFVESGTIRWLGLSECSIETLRRAKAVPGLGCKIIAVQVEFNPFTLDIEQTGFAAAAQELGVTVVAYSPLARGLVSGRFSSPRKFPQES